MTNIKDLFFKLLFTLFLISILKICNDYVNNNKDINRYAPSNGGGNPFILDTKTGAIYVPSHEGKNTVLVCKPIPNKVE